MGHVAGACYSHQNTAQQLMSGWRRPLSMSKLASDIWLVHPLEVQEHWLIVRVGTLVETRQQAWKSKAAFREKSFYSSQSMQNFCTFELGVSFRPSLI